MGNREGKSVREQLNKRNPIFRKMSQRCEVRCGIKKGEEKEKNRGSVQRSLID